MSKPVSIQLPKSRCCDCGCWLQSESVRKLNEIAYCPACYSRLNREIRQDVAGIPN